MDVALENGDVKRTRAGLPETLHGLAAQLQRAEILLRVRRGSFLYDAACGSRLFELDLDEPHAAERIIAVCNEALMRLPGFAVTSAEMAGAVVTVAVTVPAGTGTLRLPLADGERNG